MVVRVSSEIAIGHVATDIDVGFSGVLVKQGKHGVQRRKINSVVWLVLEGVIHGSGKTSILLLVLLVKVNRFWNEDARVPGDWL